MVTAKISNWLKNVGMAVLGLITIFSFASCTRKVSFLTSQVVPAARGYVKVKEDKNKNYVINVEITNLAEVERLQPSNQTYVVWMVSNDDHTKNIGRLNSSTGFLSSKLKATLETVSTLKPTRIFVTTEEDANTQYPGTRLILSTERF